MVTATSPVTTETTYLTAIGATDSVATVMAGQTFWQRFHHNALGQLDTARIAGGGVSFVPRYYGYDTQGRLLGIQLGAASTGLGYNSDRLLSAVTLPGGEQETRGYYALHGVADIGTTASYWATIARDVAYNAAGQIQRQTLPGASGGLDYFYDGLERLKADSAIAQSSPTCGGGSPPPDLDENGNPCVYDTSW